METRHACYVMLYIYIFKDLVYLIILKIDAYNNNMYLKSNFQCI